ncbi:hypothetical protein CSB11_01990 [Candidatus Campbellbacteria bacterium]|nr:MAG: hypothetical protein CSB11_01990 [Candidatus Campbellbacteria bacterium]
MKFLNPKEVVSQIHLSVGSDVIDFGFGSGAFLELILNQIGLEGNLYAYELDENFIQKLESDFKQKGTKNIFFSKINLENEQTELKDESVDFVLISSVLFMLENKKNIINETYRILKKNGRVLIIDWKESFKNIGPFEKNVFSEEKTKMLLKESPFEFERNIDVGDYHYGLIYRKK